MEELDENCENGQKQEQKYSLNGDKDVTRFARNKYSLEADMALGWKPT